MKQWLVVLLLALAHTASGSAFCLSLDNCGACTTHETWVPGENCRWCPEDQKCHTHGSWFNGCTWDNQNIVDPQKCDAGPTPMPVPKATIDKTSIDVLASLFKHLHITDIDPATCVSDVGGAMVLFKAFGSNLKSKQYSIAVVHLSRAISALSNSVSGCGVSELQKKLDVLAHSIRWANISTESIDKDVKVLVGGSDLWNDLVALTTAIRSKNPTTVGKTLSTILDDWSAIIGGCAPDNKACQFIDGLLRVVGVVAKDVAPCEAAIAPAIKQFKEGADAFLANDFKPGLKQFEAGFDLLAQATSRDSCHLKSIAHVVAKLGPKLAEAVVKVEQGGTIKIVLGTSDIYHELYTASVDFKKGDYPGVGIQVGALLAKLRTSSCTNNACVVLQGILATVQEGLTDFEGCKSDVEESWSQVESLVSNLEEKQWSQIPDSLSDLLQTLSESISGCGVSKIGSTLATMAKQLHQDSLATTIADGVQVLVSGADVVPDILKMVADAKHKNWAGLGQDLGSLSDWVTSTGCHSFVCHLAEGILEEAGQALTDLKPCETKLRDAEKMFTAGAAFWGKGQQKDAVKYWAAGLSKVAQGLDACKLADHIGFIAQDANVLGLSNVTFIEGVVKMLVHGADFYEDLYGAMQDIMNHDYRDAGTHMATVMNDISKWTTKHLCTSDICYVINGVFQFFGEIQDDFHKCENDFVEVYDNFTNAIGDVVVMEPHFHFKMKKSAITAGVHDISKGLKAMGDAMGACHITELAEIVAKLAKDLGLEPEVKWVKEVIYIFIKGVNIAHEVVDAVEDWIDHNWPGFGYNLMRLVKTLMVPVNTFTKPVSQPLPTVVV